MEERLVVGLLDRAREGHSGVLVLQGEAGIGKTALLDYAAGQAEDMTVLRASGVETEAGLPFAGLHQLLRPVLDRVAGLPARQAEALRAAFGLSSAQAPPEGDRFAVGLAVLSVLTELAENRPALCLVDDAHWLDPASADALLFAARRLDAEPVVALLATREDTGSFVAAGLPERRLGPLERAAAGKFLQERAPRLDAALRSRVLAESEGNPLALAELARALAAAGSEVIREAGAGPLPMAQRVQQMYAAQLRRLDEPARMLMLLAAAETGGEPAVVFAAAERLGISPDALTSAEVAGLVSVMGGRVVFRHPLVRAAAYHDAPLGMRRSAHRALAEALPDGVADREDQRAWHLAAAAAGWDEEVAAGLARAADRARARGGYGVASAAYERAAELTPGRTARAWRLFAAATSAGLIGELQRADQLIARSQQLAGGDGPVASQPGPPAGDPLLLAEIAYVRMDLGPGAGGRERMTELVAAAAAIADQHPERAAEMLARAIHSSWAGYDSNLSAPLVDQLDKLRLRSGVSLRPLDKAALEHTRYLAHRSSERRPDMRGYLAAIRRYPSEASPQDRVKASTMAFILGDHDATFEISASLAAECRSAGLIGWLPGALQGVAMGQLQRGDWADARMSAIEGYRLSADIRQHLRTAFLAMLLSMHAALTGDEEACRGWLEERARHEAERQEVFLAVHLGHLDLSRGRFAHARDRIDAVRDLWGQDDEFIYQPDLVEAAARSGRPDRAEEVLPWFEEWAQYTGQPWALAVAARCRALVSSDEDAAGHFLRALESHRQGARPFERARTQLVYGEWLRRQRRRGEARAQLSAAVAVFDDLGARLWAERARIELRAAGQAAAPAPAPGPLSALTPQELQIVRLAAAGASNRDIASQLFLSHRTVGYHLYKAFPKLGISSRAELPALVATRHAG